MSAYIAKAQEAQSFKQAQEPAVGLRGAMRRHPIASYFTLMYAGMVLAMLPAFLSKQGFGILPYEIPFPPILFNLFTSLAGPLLAGATMSWVVGGKEGRREFRKSVLRFRVGPQWYLVALLAAPVLGLLSVGVVLGGDPITALLGNAGGFVLSFLTMTVLVALLVNLWEESGQMAFVTPTLQRSHGPVLASIVVAVTWAFMHLPSMFVSGMDVGFGLPVTLEGVALSMALMSAYALPVRFLATWLYNNARRSVVIVALFHAGMNAMQSELGNLSPDYNPFYLIGAFAVVSVVLIAVTRGKLGYKAEQTSSTPVSDPAQAAAAPAAHQ